MNYKMFNNISSLARPVDPFYFTNLLISIVSVVVGGVALIYAFSQGDELVEAIFFAGQMAITVFVVWFFARELDPVYEWSAFVAVAVSLVMMAVWGTSVALLPVAVMAMYARVVNGVIGMPLLVTDVIVLVVVAGLVGLTDYWLIGIMGTVAMLYDRTAKYPKPLVAILMVTLTVFAAWQADQLVAPSIEGSIGGLVLMLSGIFLLIAQPMAKRPITMTTDRTKESLNGQAILNAQNLIVLTGVILAIYIGQPALEGLIILWASMVGVILWQVIEQIKPA